MIESAIVDIPLPSPPWPDTLGSIGARRVRFLDPDEGDRLLRDPLVHLIIAEASGAFRWIHLQETALAWRRDVRPRLDLAPARAAAIATVGDGQPAYRASEWRDDLGGRLVIAEVLPSPAS